MRPPQLKIILALACGLRLLLFFAALFFARDVSIFQAKDTSSYLQPARELIAPGTFTTRGVPEIIRTPGYPLFLCLGQALGHVEIVTILLQILLGSLTVFVVYLTSRKIFKNEEMAIGSAFLAACEPLSLIYGCLLLSDVLFTALLAVSMYFLMAALTERRALLPLLLAALSLAAAIFVRPIGYFLPLLMGGMLLLRAVLKRDEKWGIRAVCFLVVAILPLLCWQIRNYETTGYAGFSAAGDFNLYFHQVAAINARKQERPFYEVLDEIGFYRNEQYLRHHPEQQSWTPAKRYLFMRREGFSAVLHEPLIFTQIYVKGLLIGLFDPGASEYLRLFQLFPKSGKTMETIVRQGIWLTAINFISQNPLLTFWTLFLGGILCGYYLLAVIGWPSGAPLPRLPLLLLGAVSVYLVAVSGGTVGSSRFRLPAMLIVCVLGGRGLALVFAQAKLLQERLAILRINAARKAATE